MSSRDGYRADRSEDKIAALQKMLLEAGSEIDNLKLQLEAAESFLQTARCGWTDTQKECRMLKAELETQYLNILLGLKRESTLHTKLDKIILYLKEQKMYGLSFTNINVCLNLLEM